VQRCRVYDESAHLRVVFDEKFFELSFLALLENGPLAGWFTCPGGAVVVDIESKPNFLRWETWSDVLVIHTSSTTYTHLWVQ
jgi:hypothetical protein